MRFEGERRRTTVLFADLVGFTSLVERLDVEEAYPLVAACLLLLDGIARKHGGTVDKYLGDCLMVVFGAPAALESAPRAAVNAALEMLRRVAEYSRERGLTAPLGLHVGIATGVAISADPSGSARREFAVLGDVVNVASRLKDLAPPGRVYVGDETHRGTRDEFDYRPLGALAVKGKEQTVLAFELLSRRERLHRARGSAERSLFPELVGRDLELARLRARLTELAAGRGGIVSLVGEAGIGKSRLLDELARSEEAARVRWLEGRSLAVGATLSFHPFADLLRGWAEIGEEEEPPLAREKLAAVLASALPEATAEVAPFVVSLAGLEPRLEERRLLERIPGDAVESLLHRSVTRLLRALAAERPTVVVFEDFHWADRSSVQLLESLLPLAADCAALFVCALRPGYPETAGRLLTVAAEQHAERHLRLDLGPIAATATRRLLRGLFRDGELPAPACASIEARAGGNPFFLQEVLRGLLDAGALHRGAAGLQLDPGVGEIVVPGTVQEVILARIDRLPAAARELIQIASVIGRSFPRAVAAALVGADAELEGALSALVDAELLEPSDRHARGFTFRHPLIQEVSYDSILRTKRAELHLRVAGAVETSLREGFPGFEAMLAYHFSRGGDLARAEAHVYRAGEEAARLAAADEAIHFFEAASAIYFRLHGSGDPGKRAALSRNLALCHCNRGDFETAIEHFDRALRELGERVPRRLPARAVRAARAFPKVLLALAFPERTRRRLRRKPAPTPTQRAVLELMALRERAEVVGAPARYPLDNLLAWERFLAVNPAGVPQAAGTAVGGAALLATGGVSFALARRCLELAQDFADPDDVGEQFGLRLARFFYHYLEGDWSDRHEIEDSLVEQALGHGSLWDVSLYLGLEAARKTAQGQFMAAREPLARLEKIADSYRYDLARLNQKGWSAFLCLERRRLPEALSAYADLAERREHTGNLVGVLGGRALAERLAGEPNAARETLREIEGILGRGEFVVPAIRCYYLVARALDHVVALEEIPARGVAGAAARRRARLSTRRALRTARWVASIRPQARRLDARWRWLSGDIPGALRSLERGLVDASRLGMEPESGRIHAELALRLADARSPARSVGGCDRDAHSDAAAQIFRRLGLAWDLERLEAGVAPDTPDRR